MSKNKMKLTQKKTSSLPLNGNAELRAVYIRLPVDLWPLVKSKAALKHQDLQVFVADILGREVGYQQ